MQTVAAITAAVVAAVLFALSARLQHAAVTDVGTVTAGLHRWLARALRSRLWVTGAALGLLAMALHIGALALAPVPIVQPLGALTLVVVVLADGHGSRASVAAGLVAVCVGVSGFVLVAAAAPPVAVPPRTLTLQLGVAVAAVLGAAGLAQQGRSRSIVLAAGTALLFGEASALTRSAARHLLELGALGPAALLAAEAVAVSACGVVLVQLAYASGPPGPVVATTTALDPVTAVVISGTALGEAHAVTPAAAAAGVGFGLLAVAGVLLLSTQIPTGDAAGPRDTPVAR